MIKHTYAKMKKVCILLLPPILNSDLNKGNPCGRGGGRDLGGMGGGGMGGGGGYNDDGVVNMTQQMVEEVWGYGDRYEEIQELRKVII